MTTGIKFNQFSYSVTHISNFLCNFYANECNAISCLHDTKVSNDIQSVIYQFIHCIHTIEQSLSLPKYFMFLFCHYFNVCRYNDIILDDNLFLTKFLSIC